ncbi:MAG: hypothetical protein ABIJ96_03605 [Elusimicrobiota bacterium]
MANQVLSIFFTFVLAFWPLADSAGRHHAHPGGEQAHSHIHPALQTLWRLSHRLQHLTADSPWRALRGHGERRVRRHICPHYHSPARVATTAFPAGKGRRQLTAADGRHGHAPQARPSYVVTPVSADPPVLFADSQRPFAAQAIERPPSLHDARAPPLTAESLCPAA